MQHQLQHLELEQARAQARVSDEALDSSCLPFAEKESSGGLQELLAEVELIS